MLRADRNRLGIIGAGRIGQAMARIALRAGREVVIANRRGPEWSAMSLRAREMVRSAGPPAHGPRRSASAPITTFRRCQLT